MSSDMRTTRIAACSAAFAIGVAVAGFTTPIAAQAVPELKVKPADVTHPQEFTSVSSMRELSDGRVVVTDRGEQRLFVLDFSTGEATQFGRQGSGPEEYSMLVDVHAIGADSSIMIDIEGRRWLLFDGARIVETVPPDNATIMAVKVFFDGADAIGHVMKVVAPPRPEGVTVTGIKDSSTVILVERSSGRADTVAKLRSRPVRIERRTNAEGRVTFSSMMPASVLGSEEAAVLFTDGTIGVARMEPFRVDWRSPTGTWTRGAPLPVPRLRVDGRERRAYYERNASTWKVRADMPPGFPTPKRPSEDEFPEYFPVFPSNSVSAGPAGTLLVRRSKSADYMTPHYFVVDRSSRLLGEIALEENEEIVGAGARTLYIAFKDENDIQHIRRHPWP